METVNLKTSKHASTSAFITLLKNGEYPREVTQNHEETVIDTMEIASSFGSVVSQKNRYSFLSVER